MTNAVPPHMTTEARPEPAAEATPTTPARARPAMEQFREVAIEHGAVWLRDLLHLHGVRRPTDLSDAVLIAALRAGATDRVAVEPIERKARLALEP